MSGARADAQTPPPHPALPSGSKVARRLRLDVPCLSVLPVSLYTHSLTHTHTVSLAHSRLDFPTSPSRHAKQTMGRTVVDGRSRVPACPRAAGGTQVSVGSRTAVCVFAPSLPPVTGQLTRWRRLWFESPLIGELPAWRDVLTWCVFSYFMTKS